MGHTFVPGFSHDSLREAAEAEPEAFTVAAEGGFAGTQEVLDLLLAGSDGTRAAARTGVALLVLTAMTVALLGLTSRRRPRQP